MSKSLETPRRLDPIAVKAWLTGQQEAAQVIARERRRYLENLTADEALATYLGLICHVDETAVRAAPSPVLIAMRAALARKMELPGQ